MERGPTRGEGGARGAVTLEGALWGGALIWFPSPSELTPTEINLICFFMWSLKLWLFSQTVCDATQRHTSSARLEPNAAYIGATLCP